MVVVVVTILGMGVASNWAWGSVGHERCWCPPGGQPPVGGLVVLEAQTLVLEPWILTPLLRKDAVGAGPLSSSSKSESLLLVSELNMTPAV